MKTIRWGIIGTGTVAMQFGKELAQCPAVEIARICSRDVGKAREFGNAFHVSGCFSDLHEFLSAHQLDLIYVASPTALHEEHVTACLRAGVGVVCEKPLVTSVAAADRIFDLARERNLFCLEGMWTRFNPLVQRVREIVRTGVIGEIISMRAEIGYRKDPSDELDRSRSALWNFGVYAVSMFHYLAGAPLHVSATRATGVEGNRQTIAGLMRWERCSATFSISDEVELSNEFVVVGSNGTLRLPSPCICPTRLEASRPIFPGGRLTGIIGRSVTRCSGRRLFADPFTLTGDQYSGFHHQAAAASAAVRRGDIECPANPWNDTREVLRLMEVIESKLGA